MASKRTKAATGDRSPVENIVIRSTRLDEAEVTGLLTIRSLAEVDDLVAETNGATAHGKIVRLIQAHDDPREKLDDAAEALRGAGALAVRVVPTPRSKVVVDKPGGEERTPAPRQTSAREIVRTIIEEAKTQDRAALVAHAEEIMGRASL